ncbi:hypothetical protein CFC21_050954, partial [Triticum aestivum]
VARARPGAQQRRVGVGVAHPEPRATRAHPAVVVVGPDAQVAPAVLREHRHRAQHRRRRRPRHHPWNHPRLPRREAPGARWAGREDRRLLRRDRRDEHRGPGDGHAHGARRQRTPALRRQGHQQLLPGALPKDLPCRLRRASGLAQEHEGAQVRRPVPPLRRQRAARRDAGRRGAAEHSHPHLRHQAAPANHLLQIRRPERRLQERSSVRRLHQHVGGAYLPPRPPLRDQGQGWQAPGFQSHRRRRCRKQSDNVGHDGREQADPAGQPGLLPDQAGRLRQVHGALPRHRLRQGGGEVRRRRVQQVGVLGWLYNHGTTPLIDSFSQASADLVDIQASVLFQALRCEKRYLRIQDDELKGDTSSVDVSTPENLNRLVEVGKALLKRSVCRVNVETGKTVPDDNRGTNEEELIGFAHMLSQERKARLQKKGVTITQ